MEQFKKKQVVMLSTKQSSKFGKIYEVNRLHLYTNVENPHNIEDNLAINQHLYFISDDKIKEGDWCYDKFNNSVYPATSVVIYNMKSLEYEQYLKKIIATTNGKLGYGDILGAYYNLPQPSQEFIEKYIESYNRGDVITDVLVEYSPSSITIQTYSGQSVNDNLKAQILKINPDNTITIKITKNN